ncbi:hypothetical protein MA16_Dca027748 [Dendrobium catenatum]|uniref:Transmembrane 9 superfamily member n=1 Tax=Dendrobium catenatum TaxID=906689 RepID=A0A2I0WNM1_9ASPA|nr:hypothetical protein MA16_Dca027748 [Dendrobium catenatum]
MPTKYRVIYKGRVKLYAIFTFSFCCSKEPSAILSWKLLEMRNPHIDKMQLKCKSLSLSLSLLFAPPFDPRYTMPLLPRSSTYFIFFLIFLASCIFFLIFLASCPSNGFYLPGSYTHNYQIGDLLSVKLNSLTSIDTETPFGYYTLPFYRPLEGIKDSAENLRELLMGDRIENSPYRFRMFTNESGLILCRIDSLSATDLSLLKKRIDEMYQVNILLENLPAIRFTTKDDLFLRLTGYLIGVCFFGDFHFIFNHLKFAVLVHKYEEPTTVAAASANSAGIGDGSRIGPGYMVVGFKVITCSLRLDTESIKNLKM